MGRKAVEGNGTGSAVSPSDRAFKILLQPVGQGPVTSRAEGLEDGQDEG